VFTNTLIQLGLLAKGRIDPRKRRFPRINSGLMPNRHTAQGAFQDVAEGVTAIFQDTVRRQSRSDVCIKSNQAFQLFDLVERLFSFV